MPENSSGTVINNGSISSPTITVYKLCLNEQSENNYIQIYPIANELTIGEINELN